jgi:D-alanyl-D-alanine carboxypeptidase
MTTLVLVPEGAGPRWRKPGYGLGLMGDPESPWGPLWGHNGGGPGYRASAFHASDLGLSVCAMRAFEGDSAEHFAYAVLDGVRRQP